MSVYRSWQTVPVDNWRRLKGILSAPNLPLPIAARTSREFRACLRKILAQQQFDVAIVDHTAQFQYQNELSNIPIVVGSAHDILTQGWQRKSEAAGNPVGRLLLSCELHRVRRWEKMVFGRLDVVLSQSTKDGDLVLRLQPKAHAFVIQGWVSRLEALRIETDAVASVSNSIVYYGALNRGENVDAVEYLTEEILPLIQSQIPEVKVYLAGSHSEKLTARFAGRAEIVVTGFLPDPIGFLATMQVALLPLRVGAGIKTKTVECLSAGIPVVTTNVGAEGVGGCVGKDYLIANNSKDLAELTVDLLRNPERARTLGRSGRDMFFREYDFERRIGELELYLEDMVEKKRQNKAPCSRKCVHEAIEQPKYQY